MLDRDLAKLYCVETKYLKRQAKRNAKRFPSDFMFELKQEEFDDWRCQNVTSNSDKMGLRHAPLAFTEHGIAMLSAILNSDLAIEINIKIIRAFIELRKNIVKKSRYKLLNEKMRRIESEVDILRTNQTIESRRIDEKLLQVSSRTHNSSQILDEFQDTYIIIKRPSKET